MAPKIVAEPVATTRQYHLPETVRLAILAESDLSIKIAEIARQRLAFIHAFGSDLGSKN